MNAEQKQRAKDLIAAWKSTAYALHADSMADLLQELVDAPEAEPAPSVPDGWKHDCAGILQNDVEMWVDSCPHCGKPRPAAPTPAEREQARVPKGWPDRIPAGLPEFDALLDHIYEYGTAAEGITERAAALVRAVIAAAPQREPLSDERILEIWASNSGRPVTMGKARIIAQARAIEREILGGGE